jgi:Na+/H+ antiporter NhaD/arsenite permease-like protein
MSELLLSIKTEKFNIIYEYIKKDIVFSISFFMAITSSLIAVPRVSYIDFKVLICLFNLMVVIKAFENIQLLDKFAVVILNKCTNSRTVSLILILLAFFMSMLVTNDIALITLVPITLIISEKSKIDMLTTVILETLAANIGSSLTPMGNPQNLYIFSYYKLSSLQFFSTIFLFSITGLVWLYFLNKRNHNKLLVLDLKAVAIKKKKEAIIWFSLFLMIILSVFNIVNYVTALVATIIIAFIINKKIILQVDYLLLLTFVCFFIFIGNISSLPLVNDFMKEILNNGKSTYFGSIVLSQLISNVPCSIFISKFTPYWRELLLGVNVGGMGTLIASLASVISYKFYVKNEPKASKQYIIKFSAYNLISLVLFTLINYFLLISN